MKKAIILGCVFAVITVGVIFFVFLRLKDIQENHTLTTQLSPALLEQLQKKHISDFPCVPAPIQWEGKFLQVDHGIVLEEYGTPVNFVYNKKRNEKLNTARFFPGNDIKGLVWLVPGYKIVGRYEGGGYAEQPYYVLSYLDLEQKIILAQDTLWGGMPPKMTRSNNGSDVGKAPKEEEVIKTIQRRTGIDDTN